MAWFQVGQPNAYPSCSLVLNALESSRETELILSWPGIYPHCDLALNFLEFSHETRLTLG